MAYLDALNLPMSFPHRVPDVDNVLPVTACIVLHPGRRLGAVRHTGVTTADPSPRENQISGGEMAGNCRSVVYLNKQTPGYTEDISECPAYTCGSMREDIELERWLPGGRWEREWLRN